MTNFAPKLVSVLSTWYFRPQIEKASSADDVVAYGKGLEGGM